jgi:hypothetical protein
MIQRRTVRLAADFDGVVQRFIGKISEGKTRLAFSSLIEVALKELMLRPDAAQVIDRYNIR